jgi:hypothetical protein
VATEAVDVPPVDQVDALREDANEIEIEIFII